jgi:hypothetical protein
MRSLYDVRRWKEDRCSTRCQSRQQHGLVTKSIRHFFSPQTVTALSKLAVSRSPSIPCPGLSRDDYAKVSNYLRRTTAARGGAPSRSNITKVLFGTDAVYASLPDADKRMVLRREDLLFKWRNNRVVGSVSSAVPPGGCTSERRWSGLSMHRMSRVIQTARVQGNPQSPNAFDDNMKYTPINCDPDIGNIYEGERSL